MKIIDKIMQSDHFSDRPPVLIDIGASGEIHHKWKRIARYACCVAFDADDREFQLSENANLGYRKLIRVNRIVTADPSTNASFYLTRSPFCSSLLEPDLEKLRPWLFRDLFDVDKVSTLPTVTLGATLQSANLSYIDWFKVDSQGTDLRLFRSLPPQIRDSILMAELEPGIMDAYKQEDKLFTVMQQFHAEGFWLSSMAVKGTQRLGSDHADQIGRYMSKRILKTSPGWAELTYFRNPEGLSGRSLLLLIVFAILDAQYGFALELTDIGRLQGENPLLEECRKALLKKMRSEKIKAPLIFLHRKINKLFARMYA